MKSLPANAGDIRDTDSLSWQDSPGQGGGGGGGGMATHGQMSLVGYVWSIGSQRVRHD